MTEETSGREMLEAYLHKAVVLNAFLIARRRRLPRTAHAPAPLVEFGQEALRSGGEELLAALVEEVCRHAQVRPR
jgi:hypothetical protein